MSRRLLLDGDDLGELLHRVRSELGPDAVVIKAERVRIGGVAGFFAKEHFEVTVEVPDRSRSTPGETRGPAVGMSALLDAADAADLAGADVPANRATPTATPTATGAPSRPGPDAPARPPGAPRVSTDGDTFASLLASIDGMAQGQPAPAPGPAVPAARFAPSGATVTAATFAPLDEGVTSVPDLTGASPASRPAPVVVLPPDRPRAGRSRGGDRRALLALGVPPAVVGPGPLDEPMPLSRLLATLPRPPLPLRSAGSVLVVVGEGSQALPVATQLAQRARMDPSDVVLAGAIDPVAGHAPRLLTPAAAADHRARAAERDAVGIVALGVHPDEEGLVAATELLTALDPGQTWAVVDARRKAADLRAWMTAVAGPRPFDVVAATWVHDTQEPGTVLDLGAPVGWVDGLPATPVVWAAVLSERLGTGAIWD